MSDKTIAQYATTGSVQDTDLLLVQRGTEYFSVTRSTLVPAAGGVTVSAVERPGVEFKGNDLGDSNISTNITGGVVAVSGVGALDFSVWVRALPRAGAVDTTSPLNFCGLSNNSSNNISSAAFRMLIHTDGSLRVVYGGDIGASDNRQKVVAGFQAAYGGAVVDLVAVRSVADNDVYVYINGTLVSTTEEVEGTPGDWSDAVDSTYWNVGTGFQGVIYNAVLFLGTLEAAEVQTVTLAGVPPLLKWGAPTDVASGNLVPRRRYQVVGGTSITYDSVVYAAGDYFTTTDVSTYTETGGTEQVYQVGALVDQDLAIGYGLTYPDRSPNRQLGGASHINRVVHFNSLWQTRAVAASQSVFLANGLNNNVDTRNASQLIISGPSSSFTITGFSQGSSVAGNVNPVSAMLFLYNNTGQTLTLANESASSEDRNRIVTGTGGDVVLTGRSCILVYDDLVVDRWILYANQ